MLLLLLSCICCTLLVTGQGQPPPSPCPHVFSYVLDNETWSGRIVVPVPTAAKRMVVVVSLFVMDVELPPEHPGALRLAHDMNTVVQQVHSREAKTVEYLLEFPTQSPLPLVDKIKVNRNIICQGSPAVRSKIRTKVTFTNRLNGLLPPSTRPNKVHDLKHGHNLDMVDEGRHISPKTGGLELLDEVAEVEAQEAELMSKPKDQDQDQDQDHEQDLNTGPDVSAEDEEKLHPDDDAELLVPEANNPDLMNTPYPPDRENIPENEFDLDDADDEVELLDNDISETNSPDVLNAPKYPNGGKDREEVSDNEFDLDDIDDEVELLDNEIPEANNPDVKFKPKHPNVNKNGKAIPEHEFDFSNVEMLDNEIPVEYIPKHQIPYPKSRKAKEHASKSEFDLGDDIELLDSEIPVEQNIKPKHKDHGKNNNWDRENLPKSEFDLDDGDFELMDNDVLESDIPELQNIPKHKSRGFNIGTGFVTKYDRKDHPKMRMI